MPQEYRHITIREFHEKARLDFHKQCQEKLEEQVYKIKDKRARDCAIQAVRYVIRDIYNYYGFEAIKYIIRYGKKIDESKNGDLSISKEIKYFGLKDDSLDYHEWDKDNC